MQHIYLKLDSQDSIDEISDSLVSVPGEEITDLLTDLDINFPRSIRFNALQSVLFPILEKEYNDLLKSESEAEGPERLEESRRQTRLRWLDSFSETQFENELYRFNNKDIDKLYLKAFWKRFVNFLIKEGIPKKDIGHFIEKGIRKYQNNQGIPPVRLFNKVLEPYIYEELDTFDGLTRDLFAKRIVLSATITEIKQIGSKYGIKVPTRLTKIQVLEIVVNELKKRNEYIPEVHEELNDFNLKELEDFARLNDIIAFAYINKDQMVEIIYKEFDQKAPKVKRFNKDEELVVELEEEINNIEDKVIEVPTPLPVTPEEDIVSEYEETKESIIEQEHKEDILSDINQEYEQKAIEKEAIEEQMVVSNKQDQKSYDPDLQNSISELKEMIIDLQKQVKELKTNNSNIEKKLHKISKGLIPRWVKTFILIIFILSIILFAQAGLSIYYPDWPIVRDITWALERVPFPGPGEFIDFIQRIFIKVFGL